MLRILPRTGPLGSKCDGSFQDWSLRAVFTGARARGFGGRFWKGPGNTCGRSQLEFLNLSVEGLTGMDPSRIRTFSYVEFVLENLQ